MKTLTTFALLTLGFAAPHVSAQEGVGDSRQIGNLICKATIGNAEYHVYQYGFAGMAAYIEVPGWGQYIVNRSDEPGWFKGQDGIAYNFQKKLIRDEHNGSNQPVECN